ncbi:MAG: CDP-glycerol glycerophosphotransferase family protein [Candidatus Vogelbacteria bacterium]|nr:CDP-glycerol glycerophosphotransferase family protein [Candidatus Vogelbacteria bacterium]
MKKQTTFLIPIGNNFFARNFLRTEAFRILSSRTDVRLVLLAHRQKLDYYKAHFNMPNVVFDICPDIRGLYSEQFFQTIEQASIVTSRSHMDQMTGLFRGGEKNSPLQFIRRLGVFSFKRFFRIVGRIGRPYRMFFRAFYFAYPSNTFAGILKKYAPDVVFCPTMVWGEDYRLMREAKKAGIATAGMIFSWDTFYSKTLLRLHPDHLLVQTDMIRHQAIHLGDYPEDKIIVTGILQYDLYFKHPPICSREDFMREIGGDPSKKLILYAFSGKAGLHIDVDIVDILHCAISENLLGEDVQVLLRPYPRFDFGQEKLEKMRARYGFLAHASTTSIGTGRADWEMDEEAVAFLANSLFHADIVITIYSTFFIEAAIFDKPLVGIAFDGYRTYNYWNSARRFFDWDHLRDIKSTNAIWLATDKEEFVRALCAYLKDPARLRSERKQLVLQQAQFVDGRSGMRTAHALLSIAGLKP